MTELTTEQIIKIVIGAVVIVVAIVGLAFFFKDQILGFFNSLPGG